MNNVYQIGYSNSLPYQSAGSDFTYLPKFPY